MLTDYYGTKHSLQQNLGACGIIPWSQWRVKQLYTHQCFLLQTTIVSPSKAFLDAWGNTPTAHAERGLRTVAGKSLSSSIEHHLQDLEHRTQQITQTSHPTNNLVKLKMLPCNLYSRAVTNLPTDWQFRHLSQEKQNHPEAYQKSSWSLPEPNKMGPESLKATRTQAHQFTKDSQNTSCCWYPQGSPVWRAEGKTTE